jgi:hypothetical protein
VEAVLPIQPLAGGDGQPLRATPEAVQKALKDAATTARALGPGPAAEQLEKFLASPENQQPEAYLLLATLYVKTGERERASSAIAEAEKRLKPAPETPPAAPGQ